MTEMFRFKVLSFGLACALSLAACEDEGTDPGSDAGAETFIVTFAARMGATPFACGTAYPLGSAGSLAQLQDYRLFLSNPRAVGADGVERALGFVPDGKWQDAQVALLDFENGTGACSELGTAETNAQLRLAGALRPGDALRLTLGVPEAVNHADVGLAPAPLNLGAMFWSWQSGYKFMRVDLSTATADPAVAGSWLIHLGSTGCASAAQTVPPATACARPNRVEVTLPTFDPLTKTVVVDLAAMLATSNVAANTPGTAPGCMSGADDPECQALLPALGLDPTTGLCVNGCAQQKLFRLE